MGKNQAYKAMQWARLGSSSDALGTADALEDGMASNRCGILATIPLSLWVKDKEKELWLMRVVAGIQDGMKQGIINPSDIDVTFEDFPYYVSENTKNVLLSCAFIHLEKKEFIKQFAEISSINQRILLFGPAGSEIYQETLVKALAKHFGARLLVVDSLLLPWIPDGNDLGGLCEEDHGFFCSAESLRPDFSAGEEVERLAMTELIEVISEENKSGPLIVLLKDVEKSFIGVTESLSSSRSKFESLPSGVLIIGSHTQMDSRKEKLESDLNLKRKTEQGVAQVILRGNIDFKREPWPNISENAKDLVRHMLEPDPKLRLTAKQVLVQNRDGVQFDFAFLMYFHF
ncbi:Calcium-dependent protein kinase 3 [Zea mays]|uniref:Uncharacterized protein n=2 Tax=Zea mays TaxID=4577 RepID=A0A1D6F5R4_MAIZE|nr:hypothetical protein ZEAMMB73_Zm00001d007370 [Zea mays]PWZ36915.1 Calcium-dependent protein kinase 3 [Zea mays]